MTSVKAVAFFILSTILIPLFAQDPAVADSLKRRYADQPLPDSAAIPLLYQITIEESDPKELEYYSDLLIARSEEAEDLQYEQLGHLQRGYALQYLGSYDLAFSSFYTSLELALDAADLSAVGACYSAIADTYSLSGDSKNAKKYYRRGIAVLKEVGDLISLATTLLNAGDEYSKSDELDSAILFFQESGIIFDSLDYEIGQAYNIGNVGLVYARQGKYEEAEDRLNKASEILERLGDIYPIAEYNFSIADIYEERGEIQQAISHARFGYNIADYYGLKKEMRDGAERLARLLEKAGDLRESLNFLKEKVSLEDSLNTTEVVREMAELRRTFEVAQKQVEVDLLAQQRKTQQVITRAMVAILILTVVVIVLLYITNKKRKKLNRELALINETKTKFFSIISHDLRSPISAFYGINRVIKHLINKKRYNDLESMTDEIDTSVRSISGLLDNLLKWAVQEQGQFAYLPEPLSLYLLIEDNRALLLPVAEAKQIELVNEIPEDIRIWAEKNSILTVFRNVISNAIKFTEEGGRVVCQAVVEGEQVKILIKDTGVGIPEEQLASLFEFTASKSTYGTSGEKGIGLGVQLAHDFTLLNKGAITYSSELGRGTTVEINLKQHKELDTVAG